MLEDISRLDKIGVEGLSGPEWMLSPASFQEQLYGNQLEPHEKPAGCKEYGHSVFQCGWDETSQQGIGWVFRFVCCPHKQALVAGKQNSRVLCRSLTTQYWRSPRCRMLGNAVVEWHAEVWKA